MNNNNNEVIDIDDNDDCKLPPSSSSQRDNKEEDHGKCFFRDEFLIMLYIYLMSYLLLLSSCFNFLN